MKVGRGPARQSQASQPVTRASAHAQLRFLAYKSACLLSQLLRRRPLPYSTAQVVTGFWEKERKESQGYSSEIAPPSHEQVVG